MIVKQIKRKMVILLLDATVATAAIFALLSSHGLVVQRAHNGVEALQLYCASPRAWKATSPSPST